MRAAYLDDLRSKFLLENSVLKMEYAEVRVLHLSHKVWIVQGPSLDPRPTGRYSSSWPGQLFCLFTRLQQRPSLSGLTTPLALPFWTFFSGHFGIGASQCLKPE